MKNHQAATRQKTVPTRLLPILNDIVFILVTFVTDEVKARLVTKGRHLANLCVGSEFNRTAPSHHPTLVGRITDWTVSCVVIVPAVHELPITKRRSISIIKIGKAEAMSVLVADSAKRRLCYFLFNQFLYAAVTIDIICLVAIVDGTITTIVYPLRICLIYMRT
jgi:hypothetical protein